MSKFNLKNKKRRLIIISIVVFSIFLIGTIPKILRQYEDNNNMQKVSKITNEYKGADLYVPYSTKEFGDYKVIIDKMVEVGCNSIGICPRLDMVTSTSNSLNRQATDKDIIEIFKYAKSKGLRTMLKCHYSGAVTGQFGVKPTNTRLWIQSWSNNVIYYTNLTKDYLDIVCLTNECSQQTKGNADLWQALNDGVKTIKSTLKTTTAATKNELSTTVLFNIVDYIGCNLYISIGGNINSSPKDLQKNMFHDTVDKINWIKKLNEISLIYNKPIIITEVGCTQSEEALTTPAKWGYKKFVHNNNAQALYYNVAIGTLLKNNNIKGVFIWGVADGFTFIGNSKSESMVKKLFKSDN